ncbi:MAG: hypothetical protein ACHP7P_14530 [Terriglobales bacterium]
MRHLKVLGVALVAIFALGITATSAFATLTLPDVHILEGEKYPLHLNFADNGKTPVVFHSTGGGILEGKGLSILTLTNDLSALGLFSMTFLNFSIAGQNCNTAGDAAGEILASGEFHILPIKLKPLEIGIALLVTEVTIKCGATTLHLKGCLLSTAETANELEVKAIKAKLEGDKKGKNTLTKYFNDEGKEVECKLLLDIGTGFKQSSVEVGETVLLEALEKKMFTILNT